MEKLEKYRIVIAVFCILSCLSGTAYAFDKDAADKRWNTVRGTAQESSFLIDLFITERMPGNYPHNVRERFGEIADRSDAVYLLDKLIDPAQKKQHIYAYTLLKELVDKNFIDLFEEYFNCASDQDIRNKLFNLLTRKNSSAAFKSAGQCLERLQAEGEGGEAVGYLNYMIRFNQPDVRETLISAASSGPDIVRAASFVALRNYPDDEVLALTEKALLEFSEKGMKSGESLLLKEGLNERNFSLKNIIEITKKKIEKSRLLDNSQQEQGEKESSENHITADSSIAFAEAETVDYLAQQFAPVLYLSSEGGIGVDLRTADYPYQDYLPISVHNLTTHPTNNVFLIKNWQGQTTSYPLTNSLLDSYLGLQLQSSYLSFVSLWGGGDDLDDINNAYRQLANTPTVYYKIFRDNKQKNPIAIQYWFFYFYNDWAGDHPGDWETITVFLNSKAQGVEVVYSTHYEANRYSWSTIIVDTIEKTHPKVYVSNGGHGSYYESNETSYPWFDNILGYFLNFDDNHLGDREVLYPSNISAQKNGNYEGTPYILKPLPADESSWSLFKGRWGDQDSAPPSPLFRIDAPSYDVCPSSDGKDDGWECGKHPPYDPYNNCAERRDTRIAGDDKHKGPWYWAAGYGLDEPWESAADCVPIVEPNNFSWNLFLPAILAANSSASKAPKLIAPANGSILDTLVPLYEFDASDASENTDFRLEVSKDPSFSSMIEWMGGSTSNPYLNSSFRFSNNLEPSTVYYWRMYFRYNNDISGPYSEVRSFTTGSEGTLLSAPSLIAPDNGSIQSSPVNLEWSAVNGAVEYLVSWSSDTYSAWGWTSLTDWKAWIFEVDEYEWWIRPRNNYALGFNSASRSFTLSSATELNTQHQHINIPDGFVKSLVYQNGSYSYYIHPANPQ